MAVTISVIVPTYFRPEQMQPLLHSLTDQTLPPIEVIVVDGTPPVDRQTEQVLSSYPINNLPFTLVYLRSESGIAIQRNLGIDHARGELIACIDDDIRPAPDYFARLVEVFESDKDKAVGGVCGYIDNQRMDSRTSLRWRLYRKLNLFSTYEPGRYDRTTGYPVNTYLDPPFEGVKEVDFLSGGNTVWRREVFDQGLRFPTFLDGAGPLEDVYLALRASQRWRLLKCGSAHCLHLHAASGRRSRWTAGYKRVKNYWLVYIHIVQDRRFANNLRFWRVQLVQILYLLFRGIIRQKGGDFVEIAGRLYGIAAVAWSCVRRRLTAT